MQKRKRRGRKRKKRNRIDKEDRGKGNRLNIFMLPNRIYQHIYFKKSSQKTLNFH